MNVTSALQVCKCRTCEPEQPLCWRCMVRSPAAADVQSKSQIGSRRWQPTFTAAALQGLKCLPDVASCQLKACSLETCDLLAFTQTDFFT